MVAAKSVEFGAKSPLVKAYFVKHPDATNQEVVDGVWKLHNVEVSIGLVSNIKMKLQRGEKPVDPNAPPKVRKPRVVAVPVVTIPMIVAARDFVAAMGGNIAAALKTLTACNTFSATLGGCDVGEVFKSLEMLSAPVETAPAPTAVGLVEVKTEAPAKAKKAS